MHTLLIHHCVHYPNYKFATHRYPQAVAVLPLQLPTYSLLTSCLTAGNCSLLLSVLSGSCLNMSASCRSLLVSLPAAACCCDGAACDCCSCVALVLLLSPCCCSASMIVSKFSSTAAFRLASRITLPGKPVSTDTMQSTTNRVLR
jgi:hypothetical protein